MADANLYRPAGFDSLRWRAVAVTPDDDNDLAQLAAVITARTDGDIVVTASGGGTVTFYINAGSNLLCFVDRVHATGTTATGIVALYAD